MLAQAPLIIERLSTITKKNIDFEEKQKKLRQQQVLVMMRA